MELYKSRLGLPKRDVAIMESVEGFKTRRCIPDNPLGPKSRLKGESNGIGRDVEPGDDGEWNAVVGEREAEMQAKPSRAAAAILWFLQQG